MERNANAYRELVAATVKLMNERIQYDNIASEDDSCFSDALHEVVDGQVPHYYSDIFTVMAADGIDHEFDDSGLIPDTKDVTVILQARIYEALYNDVSNDCGLVWFEEEESEDVPEYWVLDAKTKVFIEQGVTLEVATACCDSHYEIGLHLIVEDINDVVVYDPATKGEDNE